MDVRAISDLRELARRDDELAADTGRLRRLDAEVAAIRTRAESIAAFFAAYPAAETKSDDAIRSASAELELRQAELGASEAALANVRDERQRDLAERAVARATDRVSAAEAHLARTTAERAELERDAATLPAEVPGLQERARSVSEQLPEVTPPGDGLRPLIDWCSHAHAELFVVTGQLDATRERIVREANELASMLLGDPTYGSTVAQALARVERR
jgi:chromosome segregation ATPase